MFIIAAINIAFTSEYYLFQQETFYDSCDDEHLINVAADHAVRRKRLNRRVKVS